MMGSQPSRAGWACVALLLLIGAGCATTNGIMVLDPQGRSKKVSPAEVDEMSGGEGRYLFQVGDQVNLQFLIRDLREGETPWNYRIEIGDNMEVRLSPDVSEDRPVYRIDVGDVIGVSFLNNWPLNVTLTVRPDGVISPPEVGDVKVAGLTAEEVRNKLTALYKKTGIIEGEPNITVNVDFANLDRLESMSRDITVRPDGCIRLPALRSDVRVAGLTVSEACEALRAEASKVLRDPPVVSIVVFPYINNALRSMNGIFTVRPDGKIFVPRLGDIQAAGYSAEEVRDTLVAACSGLIHNPVDPSIDIVKMTGSRIYVGGEVGVPGEYPLDSTPTALQAVIMAKGPTNESRLNTVLVMRRNPNGKPYVFKTNLRMALSKGLTDNDIPLRPFDVVYVPKKRVSRANLFVEQYIDRMVPFNNTLGIQANYYMNTQKVESETRNANMNLSPPTKSGNFNFNVGPGGFLP